jgi:hypothetical protein
MFPAIVMAQSGRETEKKLTFLNKTVNLGNVSNNTILNARFYFVNSGQQQVKIEYVNPDCSCTNYLLSQKIILPSDTAYVELQVNTNDKYGLNKIYSTMKADTFVKMYKLTIIFNVFEP